MNLTMKQKQTHRQRTELWLPREEWGKGGMDSEFRGSKIKCLQNGQIIGKMKKQMRIIV